MNRVSIVFNQALLFINQFPDLGMALWRMIRNLLAK